MAKFLGIELGLSEADGKVTVKSARDKWNNWNEKERLSAIENARNLGKDLKKLFVLVGARELYRIELSKDSIKLISEYHDKYGDYPGDRNNKEDKYNKVGSWRSAMITAKNKPSSTRVKFLQEYQELANKLGKQDMFDLITHIDYKEHMEYCANFHDIHGYYPHLELKIPIQKPHVIWLVNMRRAKNKPMSTRGKFLPEYQKYANKLGKNDMFDGSIDIFPINIKRIKYCAKFHDKNKHYPSVLSKDTIEKEHATFLVNMRRSKSGKTLKGVKFLQEYQELANKLKKSDMFDNAFISKNIEHIEYCAKFHTNNKHYPKCKSKDSIEKKHGMWRVKMCRAKNRPEGTNAKFLQEYQELANKLKKSDMFDYQK